MYNCKLTVSITVLHISYRRDWNAWCLFLLQSWLNLPVSRLWLVFVAISGLKCWWCLPIHCTYTYRLGSLCYHCCHWLTVCVVAVSLTCDLCCSYERFEVLAVFDSTVLVNHRAITIVINLWFVLQLREVWSVGSVCQYNAGSAGITLHYKREVRLVQLLPFAQCTGVWWKSGKLVWGLHPNGRTILLLVI